MAARRAGIAPEAKTALQLDALLDVVPVDTEPADVRCHLAIEKRRLRAGFITPDAVRTKEGRVRRRQTQPLEVGSTAERGRDDAIDAARPETLGRDSVQLVTG